MGRTVTDVAVLLNGMTGVDAADPVTQQAAALADADFMQALSLEHARRLRVGVLTVGETTLQARLAQAQAEQPTLTAEQVQAAAATMGRLNARVRATVQVLENQGIATVAIDIAELPPETRTDAILVQGFRDEFDAFWQPQGLDAPVASLAALVAFNAEDPTQRAPYGQGLLLGSLESSVAPADYQALATTSQHMAQVGLRRLLQEYGVDVLLINDFTQLYAAAGFPALSVPAGYDDDGQPYGVTFSGDYLSEPQLLAVGYAYEQATQARHAPDLEARLAGL
jgi:amidase